MKSSTIPQKGLSSDLYRTSMSMRATLKVRDGGKYVTKLFSSSQGVRVMDVESLEPRLRTVKAKASGWILDELLIAV